VQLLHTLELDPGNPLAHMQLSRAYLALHRCPAALDEAVKGGTAVVNYEGANLGFAAVACGDSALARRELQRLLDMATTQYVPADVIARLYAGLGERAKALDWLDRAYQQDTWSLILLKAEPMYDNLRSEPRFQSLVKKMKLP
jgi:tetratricopeptide (TPR) repeat protein